MIHIIIGTTYILEDFVETKGLPLNMLCRLHIRNKFCSHWDLDIFRRGR